MSVPIGKQVFSITVREVAANLEASVKYTSTFYEEEVSVVNNSFQVSLQTLGVSPDPVTAEVSVTIHAQN